MLIEEYDDLCIRAAKCLALCMDYNWDLLDEENKKLLVKRASPITSLVLQEVERKK